MNPPQIDIPPHAYRKIMHVLQPAEQCEHEWIDETPNPVPAVFPGPAPTYNYQCAHCGVLLQNCVIKLHQSPQLCVHEYKKVDLGPRYVAMYCIHCNKQKVSATIK